MFGSSDLSRLRAVSTRSVSAENKDGSVGGGGRALPVPGVGPARDLGVGWKVSPCVDIQPGETFDLARIESAGRITHMWFTCNRTHWRSLILRAYWDDSPTPAVEVPYGDFFCNGWGVFTQVNSVPVAANPNGGFNAYWPMPFRKSALLTIENQSDTAVTLFYQITYEQGEDQEGEGYFHAQFRRSNPLDYLSTHPILESVEGAGHYVGTYLAWGANSTGWWGEGELKMFLDSDTDFPTICGTGTEDYFGGAWNFDVPGKGYTEYSTPYLGMPQVIRPDGLYASQQRFGLYRWHVMDAVHFAERLSVTIQALGWQRGHRYLPLRDDIASTAYFYLDRPSTARPELPSRDDLYVFPGDEPAPDLE